MRALVVLLLVAGCGGGAKPTAAPDPGGRPIPLAGLEAVHLGDSLDTLRAQLGGEVDGDALWIEETAVEQLPASVALRFASGALRGATVAFAGCSDLDRLASELDARLGKRTAAEPGIAAWSKDGWDLALYCERAAVRPYTRIDVHPHAAF